MFKNLNRNDVIGIVVNSILCAAGGAVMALFQVAGEKQIYREECRKRIAEEETEEIKETEA